MAQRQFPHAATLSEWPGGPQRGLLPRHTPRLGGTQPNGGVDIPVIKERRIAALPVQACSLLLRLAGDMHHGECLAAAGIMLFAESARRKWSGSAGNTSAWKTR